MWTDDKSREFIATEYPWFLATFDNYSQPIQRADAIRYFVLAHFGGVYIDLDDVRLHSLRPKFPSQIRPTVGRSNSATHHEPLLPYLNPWMYENERFLTRAYN